MSLSHSPKNNSAATAPQQLPPASVRPEFVPLPARGGDAVCNLSRSWWYGAESNGLIRLVRLRKKGALRGRVLLPVEEAVELIRKLGSEAAADITVAAKADRVARAQHEARQKHEEASR